MPNYEPPKLIQAIVKRLALRRNVVFETLSADAVVLLEDDHPNGDFSRLHQ